MHKFKLAHKQTQVHARSLSPVLSTDAVAHPASCFQRVNVACFTAFTAI